jgi:hypothetical protein
MLSDISNLKLTVEAVLQQSLQGSGTNRLQAPIFTGQTLNLLLTDP